MSASSPNLQQAHRVLFVAGRREGAENDDNKSNVKHAAFPTRFQPVQWEQDQLAQWEREGTFALSLKQNSGPHFVFQEGPPTANGRPGLHHVLARTFKDLECRWKTMQGYKVERKAGWDCHGLPVEREVEKTLGLHTVADVQSFGVEQFNKHCAQSVWKYQEEWQNMTKRMGYWTDLQLRYATMDVSYMESEWWAVQQLYRKGYLKRGYKVMPYSPQTGCTYSQRDLAEGYKQVTDLTAFVRFSLTDEVPFMANGSDNVAAKNVSMLVWTSTPWTLPANVMLAVSQTLQYVLVKVVKATPAGRGENTKENDGVPERLEMTHFRDEEVLCVANDRLVQLEKMTFQGGCNLEVVARCLGSELVGLHYSPPFVSNNSLQDSRDEYWLVVHADFVNNEVGTGVVHVAPLYGEDDYQLCSRAGLFRSSSPDLEHVVGLDGRFVDSNPRVPASLHGLDVTLPDTQETVLSLCRDSGILVQAKQMTHDYPFCWRNKSNRLLYYAMESWFVSMGDPAVRSRMMGLNSAHVEFAPANVKYGRFGKWLEESKDWCVSRKRTWGCPMPVWVCRKELGGCGRENCVGSREELRSLLLESDGALLDDLHTTLVDKLNLFCPACGDTSGAMTREPYVLDCWFDSGCAPFAQWHYPFAFSNEIGHGGDMCLGYTGGGRYNGSAGRAVDFVAEGQDQCRGWFYSLLALSTTLFDCPAYNKCLVLGLVLDKNGQKMSKSLGNGVDPWKHFNEEGADAMRWYLLGMCAPWAERRFDAHKVRLANQKFFSVLFNVSKWWFTQWQEEVAGQLLEKHGKSTGFLDRWVMSRLVDVVKACNDAFESDHFHLAVVALEKFVNEDLSKTYLRLSRAHFCHDYTSFASPAARPTKEARLACLETLREALLVLSRLVAPMAPFFVDTLYRALMSSFTGVCDPNDSVHLSSWPMHADFEHCKDSEAEQQVLQLQQLLDTGRVLHEKGSRPGRLPSLEAFCTVPSGYLDDELKFVLAHELNFRNVHVLQSSAFEKLLSTVQETTLRPNLATLFKRFKAEMNDLQAALSKKFGSNVGGSTPVPSMTADTVWTNPNAAKSKKQLKREMKVKAKQTMKASTLPVNTAWKGAAVDFALHELKEKGHLAVQTTNRAVHLFAQDLVVSQETRDGFGVSVESPEGDNGMVGLVVNYKVTSELVSRYLVKETTHFVNLLRKNLEKERLEKGQGPLGLVALRVVMQENGMNASTKPFAVVSEAQWARLMELTRADPTVSFLEQYPNNALVAEREKNEPLGLTQVLQVRGYEAYGGCCVHVHCMELDSQSTDCE